MDQVLLMSEIDIGSKNGSISRRGVLSGLIAASFLPVLAKAHVGGRQEQTFDGFETSSSGLSRTLHSVTPLLDGRLLIAGGELAYQSGDSIPVSTVEIYDPQNDSWQIVSPMLSARSRHAAVALPNGMVMVLGGFLHGPLPSVEIYNVDSDMWIEGPALTFARCDHAAALSNEAVIVSGGLGQAGSAPLEICPVGDLRRLPTP